jgi:uncharacterized membrane protein
MKRNYDRYTGNFLFALNFFIIFLLVFENKLVVPQWLQPFGRMHPMILHFPIVLLLLSMVMEFFRFKSVYNDQEFYRNFTASLLFLGVISSGITVIMGLFLSQEQGYARNVLTWHKWSGISVFFISSAIYYSRNSSWYKASVAKAGALITTLCLIFAGHFGATLTHGDNFIWQPVLAGEQKIVPLEDAVVFDHVIQPVFQAKCTGCHNPDKNKGRLILTDSASILKGGKTGRLWVAGDPTASLLLKRVHLPADDKKHMPPSGKTQLTPDEIALMHLWIKSGADFKQKVSTLPTGDSLRMMATSILRPGNIAEEVFHFAAAGEGTIKKLNTNYCVVSPLAKESPALTVNIYNREAYTPETLEKLQDVKLQIVSLELSKMPVKNDDLKKVARFENLQRLNLNFTDITGDGLRLLTPLKNLKSLYISGTHVNFSDLQQYLPAFENLRTLAIWDTGLSVPERQRLESAHQHIQFLGGLTNEGNPPIKLNSPRIKNSSAVFDDSILLQLIHPVGDVEIRFTLDGTDPDSIASPLFDKQILLNRSTAIKARAYKSGWLSSSVAVLNVYRSGIKPDSVILLTKLNRVHQAKGAATFFDHQMGSFNANSPAWANNWAGFIKNDMALVLEFRSPTAISSVALNTLVETETFIFPPSAIEVWGGASKNDLKLITRIKPDLPTTYSKPFIKFIECEFQTHTVSYLKIVSTPVMKLPSWHKSKDRAALLLIDEVFIN